MPGIFALFTQSADEKKSQRCGKKSLVTDLEYRLGKQGLLNPRLLSTYRVITFSHRILRSRNSSNGTAEIRKISKAGLSIRVRTPSGAPWMLLQSKALCGASALGDARAPPLLEGLFS